MAQIKVDKASHFAAVKQNVRLVRVMVNKLLVGVLHDLYTMRNVRDQYKTEKERFDEKYFDMGCSAKWEVYLGIYDKAGVQSQRYST